MTNILVLGYSKIFVRRILPALLYIDKCKNIDVASASHAQEEIISNRKIRNTYVNYDIAIRNSNANWVYISTVNSLHEQLAELCIKNKKNVIVDKPAALSEKIAKKLVESANRNSVKIVEAEVFLFHPQFDILKDMLIHQNLRRIIAVFSIPPFENDNFRNFSSLGGGVVPDMSAYIFGLGRFFWEKEPKRVLPHINFREGEVIKSISILLDYGDGKSFIGTYGFDTHYANKALFLTDKSTIEIERVFTITPDIQNVIKFNSKGEYKEKKVEASDPFKNFLENVLSGNVDFEQMSANLISNARGLDTIMDILR